MNWRKVVGHELKSIGLVMLYFLFCFGIILTLKKLFLADYRIEFYALSVTVVSAVLAAKVVVTLDDMRAGTRFDASRALLTAVFYKTLVYGAVAFGVLFMEKLFHAYRATGGLGRPGRDVGAPGQKRDLGRCDLCWTELCGVSPLHGDRSPVGRGDAPAHAGQPG